MPPALVAFCQLLAISPLPLASLVQRENCDALQGISRLGRDALESVGDIPHGWENPLERIREGLADIRVAV